MEPQVGCAGITLGTGAAGFGEEGGSPYPYPAGLSFASDESLKKRGRAAEARPCAGTVLTPRGAVLTLTPSCYCSTTSTDLWQFSQPVLWHLTLPSLKAARLLQNQQRASLLPRQYRPHYAGWPLTRREPRHDLSPAVTWTREGSWHVLSQEEVWQGGGAIKLFRVGHPCHRLLG